MATKTTRFFTINYCHKYIKLLKSDKNNSFYMCIKSKNQVFVQKVTKCIILDKYKKTNIKKNNHLYFEMN